MNEYKKRSAALHRGVDALKGISKILQEGIHMPDHIALARACHTLVTHLDSYSYNYMTQHERTEFLVTLKYYMEDQLKIKVP